MWLHIIEFPGKRQIKTFKKKRKEFSHLFYHNLVRSVGKNESEKFFQQINKIIEFETEK